MLLVKGPTQENMNLARETFNISGPFLTTKKIEFAHTGLHPIKEQIDSNLS